MGQGRTFGSDDGKPSSPLLRRHFPKSSDRDDSAFALLPERKSRGKASIRNQSLGGAEHARWVFDYNPDENDDDESGYEFGAHAFLAGEYVSISGQDGKLYTFLVVTVDPVVLSVDLVKSFEMEIKV